MAKSNKQNYSPEMYNPRKHLWELLLEENPMYGKEQIDFPKLKNPSKYTGLLFDRGNIQDKIKLLVKDGVEFFYRKVDKKGIIRTTHYKNGAIIN